MVHTLRLHGMYKGFFRLCKKRCDSQVLASYPALLGVGGICITKKTKKFVR